MAKHNILERLNGKPLSLILAEALLIEDGNRLKGPSLLIYTLGMPVLLLYNIYTLGRLVNRLRGIAVSVVHDPDTKIIEVSSPYILYDRPLRYILVQYKNPTSLDLPLLELIITPIFLIKSSNSKPIYRLIIYRT
jgi:hypothetical protein